MITVSDAGVRKELIERLNRLTENSQPLWGKMNVSQMLRHCRQWEEMIHGNIRYKRPLIGRLIGPLILPQVLKGATLRRNSPTIPEMVVSDTGISVDEERQKLIGLLARYADYNIPDNTFIHPFFGRMTKAQIMRLVYLHLDHHLSQFAV